METGPKTKSKALCKPGAVLVAVALCWGGPPVTVMFKQHGTGRDCGRARPVVAFVAIREQRPGPLQRETAEHRQSVVGRVVHWIETLSSSARNRPNATFARYVRLGNGSASAEDATLKSSCAKIAILPAYCPMQGLLNTSADLAV